MITSHQGYMQAREALRDLEEALAALRQQLGNARAELFAAMAQDYLDSIAAIRQEIDDYIGIAAAQLARAPLWMGLEGAGLGPENIRTSLLSGWLERLRKSVLAAAGFARSGEATRGRRPKLITEKCDFRLVGFQAGSLKIGLDLPGPEQLPLFGEELGADEVKRALEDLLEKAAQMADLQHHTIEASLVKEPSPRDTFLIKQVLRLTPSSKGRVRAVVLEGALVPRRQPVRLSAGLRPIFARLLVSGTEPEEIQELEGTLREIDLDQRHFIPRERPEDQPDVTVYFDPGLIEDAKRALDRRVRVEAAPVPGLQRRLSALLIEELGDAAL